MKAIIRDHTRKFDPDLLIMSDIAEAIINTSWVKGTSQEDEAFKQLILAAWQRVETFEIDSLSEYKDIVASLLSAQARGMNLI